MANVMEWYKFSLDNTSGLMKPIIFCTSSEIEELSEAYSMNIPIAKELQKSGSSMMRTMKMESILSSIISKLGDNPIIKDIDVMFNPDYQLDVLRTLMNVSKRKSFMVVWPGTHKDGKLIYAQEGYSDYKSFDLNDYDITVVIQEDRHNEVFRIN